MRQSINQPQFAKYKPKVEKTKLKNLNKMLNKNVPLLTPEEIAQRELAVIQREQQAFLLEYNELVKKHKYALVPALRFELQRIVEPKVEPEEGVKK